MGSYWAQRGKHSTISVITISAFYLLWEFVYSSLLRRQGGICLMKKYPFLIGAVTGVTCVPGCVLNVRMCVCVCACAWECARSGSRSFCTLVILKPRCEETSTATIVHFVIPLLTTELLFVSIRMGKSRTLDVNTPQRLNSLKLTVKNFSILPQCWGLLRALLFCLTGPRLIWTKKVWWSPLEVLYGYDVMLEYIHCSLGNSRGVASAQ